MPEFLMQTIENCQDMRAISFYQLAENLNAGLILTSPKLEKPNPQIVYVNSIIQEMSGYTADELIGQSPRIFQGEKTNRSMMNTLKENLESGKVFRGETVNYRKDGSTYDVELNIIPILDANNQALFYLGIQYDISAKRAAERAFLEAEQLLLALEAEKELYRMKSDFVNHFAEYVRHPLTVIRVAAELLDRHNKQIAPERIHSRLRLIMSEVDYMATMLDEIRLAANGFEAQPVLHHQNIELGLMIEDIIAHLKNIYPDREIIFEPINVIPQFLQLDSRMVRVVLQHIFGNAAKFSPQKGKVSIRIHSLADYIEIRVKDNGIGIPEESRGQLFKEYYRAPNAVCYKGIGLGLAIVKKNLELLGGSIEINSEENKGTEVIIRLPKELTA